MNGRRNNKTPNGELPIPSEKTDAGAPDGRIDLAPPHGIDITSDRLGPLFLARRHSMGLKIEDVAEDIKVKPDYLRAIEEENFGALPTPEYARLFIKAYAERLGFDLAEIYALLDLNPAIAESSSHPTIAVASEPAEPVHYGGPAAPALPLPPVPSEIGVVRRRKKSSPSFLWIVPAIAVVLAVVAWVLLRPPARTVRKSPTPEARTQTAPPVPEPVISDSLPMPSATQTTGPMELTLQFERDTWTFLEADHDTIVRSRVLKPGERIAATAAESFVLSLGQTRGVTATVNGRPLRPFSTWANRLNRHLLTQDSVLKLLEPAPATDSAAAVEGT